MHQEWIKHDRIVVNQERTRVTPNTANKKNDMDQYTPFDNNSEYY